MNKKRMKKSLKKYKLLKLITLGLVPSINRKYKELKNLKRGISSNSTDYLPSNYQSKIHYYFDYAISKNLLNSRKTLFVDIGANEGQSARAAYDIIPNVDVISYEPLKSCLDKLENIKKTNSNYVFKNLALSNSNSPITINEVNSISGLSSTLKIKSDYTYLDTDKDTTIKESYEVPASTMKEEKSCWDEYNADARVLKIDTQGTELQILENAKDILTEGYFDILKIEVMVIEKYEGQDSYIKLLSFLDSCGFIVYRINPIYRELNKKSVDPSSYGFGHDTEYDFIFIHKNFLKK